jgi:ATP-binding cassette subfamily B protein
MIRTVREPIVLARLGTQAAPGWMAATAALTLANGLSAALYPVGFLLFANALQSQRGGQLAFAAVFTGSLIAIYWAAATLEANVGFGLVDRVDCLVSGRIAELIQRVPGIDHLERSEQLQELDQVVSHRDLLASGPKQLLSVFGAMIRGVLTLVLLWFVAPIMLILPILGMAPVLAEAASSRRRQRAEDDTVEARRLADELFRIVTTADQAKELRISGAGPDLDRRFDELSRGVSTRTVRAAIAGSAMVVGGWSVFVIGFLVALAVVVRQAIDGAISAGTIVLAVFLAQQLRALMADIGTTGNQLLRSCAVVRQLKWLEGLQEETAGVDPPSRLERGITFRNLSFRYPGADEDVIRSIDLHLPAGSTVAIVGENGAGKTTIVKLLAKLYEPTAGTIEVDGCPLDQLDSAAWRARLTGTFQDFVPFELLVRETVGVGDLERIDDAEAVTNALDRIGSVDLIDELGGLEAPVGTSFPGGRELSLGQWQRLAVGRGTMRDRPLVLMLDEPTASLDTETEHLLFRRYVESAARARDATGAITVVVSHRFSTVRFADVIVLLEDGGVREVGSHDELVARGGVYAELIQLQARAYR